MNSVLSLNSLILLLQFFKHGLPVTMLYTMCEPVLAISEADLRCVSATKSRRDAKACLTY